MGYPLTGLGRLRAPKLIHARTALHTAMTFARWVRFKFDCLLEGASDAAMLTSNGCFLFHPEPPFSLSLSVAPDRVWYPVEQTERKIEAALDIFRLGSRQIGFYLGKAPLMLAVPEPFTTKR